MSDSVYRPPQSATDPAGSGPGLPQPLPLDFSAVLNTAGRAYQPNLGLGVGLTLVAGGIAVAAVTLVILLFMTGLGGAFAVLANPASAAGGEENWMGAAAVAIGASALGYLALFLVMGPLFAGYSLSGLYMVRGSADFMDLFAGFRRYTPVLGATLVLGGINLLLSLGLSAPQYVGYYLLFTDDAGGGAWLVQLGQVTGMLSYPITLYLTARWFMVYPLIIERKLGAIESLRGSWQITQPGQWWILLLVLLVSFGIGISLVLCILPVLFAAPFALCLQGAAYQQLLGEAPTSQTPAA